MRATGRCRQQNWRRSVLAACRVRGPGVWSEPQQETLVPHSRRPPQGPPPSSCCWIRTTDPWDLRAGIATAPLRLQRPRERPRESLQQQAALGPPSGKAPMSPAVMGHGQPGHQAEGENGDVGRVARSNGVLRTVLRRLGAVAPVRRIPGVSRTMRLPALVPWPRRPKGTSTTASCVVSIHRPLGTEHEHSHCATASPEASSAQGGR